MRLLHPPRASRELLQTAASEDDRPSGGSSVFTASHVLLSKRNSCMPLTLSRSLPLEPPKKYNELPYATLTWKYLAYDA